MSAIIANHEDPKLVQKILYKIKSQGLFDQFRKECLADVDTKPAYQNLQQRVESHVEQFLSRQTWTPNLNKNQLRESLRRHLNQSVMLSSGVERIIEQVVNPKILSVIKPKIDEAVCAYLGIDLEQRRKVQEERKLRRLQAALSPPGSQLPQPLMSLSGLTPTKGASTSTTTDTSSQPTLSQAETWSPATPYSAGEMYPYMQTNWGSGAYGSFTS